MLLLPLILKFLEDLNSLCEPLVVQLQLLDLLCLLLECVFDVANFLLLLLNGGCLLLQVVPEGLVLLLHLLILIFNVFHSE